EIKQGLTIQAVILQGGSATLLAMAPNPALILRRTLVYRSSDDESILDFVLTESKVLYLLRTRDLTAYKWDGARWVLLNALNIDRSTPAPRDARGHLVWQTAQLDTYLAGMQCTAPLMSDGTPNGVQCREVDDPWPLDN